MIKPEADSRLDRPDNINNFHLIVDLSMMLTALSLVGCVYVFYRVYKLWILSKKKLAMTYRLPFYTACTDFLLNGNFFLNMIHTAIYARVWDDIPCKIIAVFNWAFLTINVCLYVVIAVITYLRICRGIHFNYGKYDYKLWLIVIVGSLIIQLINLQNYGKREYWCAAKSGQFYSAIILFSIIAIILIIILFCYLSVLKKIHKTINFLKLLSSSNQNDRRYSRNGNTSVERCTEFERKATKKILSYIAVFILQWTPISISQGARLVLDDAIWVYVMGSIGRSFGGIGNMIQFIINEGFISRNYDTASCNENGNELFENSRLSSIRSNEHEIITISEVEN
ncbi:hypothetical protein GLOIN_2v1490005 [Rhizophagus clarus]|uniref:G-protein coupled receptors family 1 profile domain-containing protein n=1 Tax=Rhizophagus clarus TaxID=94130 RepID=A0A8H3M1C0_9GLOM|nr:hypothetical protein GLOIN_2v1490005 [Rhizophagus clarus]